jgi:hypothetical protein
MNDEIAEVAGAGRPITIDRDAPGVLPLMAACVLAACIFAALVIWALGYAKWPDIAAIERVHALCWIGLLAVGVVALLVLAFCSPYLGRVSAKAGPVDVEIDGTRTPPPARDA